MRSTMQTAPLTVGALVAHAAAIHGRLPVSATRAAAAAGGAGAPVGAGVGVAVVPATPTTTGEAAPLGGPGVDPPGREVVRHELHEVLDLADRLAAVLADLGVRGDAVVATLSRNTVGHLAAYAAVPSMGAVLHPVNIRLPAADVGGILDAAGDEVVLVDADVLAEPGMLAVLAGRPALRHVVVLDPDADIGPAAHDRPGLDRGLDPVRGLDPDRGPDLDRGVDLGRSLDRGSRRGPDGALGPGSGARSGARSEGRRPALPAIPGVDVHDGAALLAAAPAGRGRELREAARPDELDAAALCFTSGSTGRPRGVAYSHRSIHLHSWGIAAGDAFAIGPEHTVLPAVPMFHVLAWGLPYASLLVGAGLALPGRFTDPAALVELAGAAGATHAAGVPTVFTRVLDHLAATPGAALPGTLRELMVGGAPCPPTLFDGFAARGVAVRHAWGMTETSPLGALARADPRADTPTARRQQLSQGRLASAVRGRVTGPDGAPLPADGRTVGELQVSGPWVTARYLDEPVDTAREWLGTGDLATLDGDGFLVVVDRVADLVKSGGEWISPRRVEALVGGVEGVADVAVVAVPDPVWGQRPAAVLVLDAPGVGETGAPSATGPSSSPAASEVSPSVTAPRAAPSPAVLRAAVEAELPRWQVPDTWWVTDALPVGPTGKVDRSALAAGLAAGAFAPLDATHYPESRSTGGVA